MDNWPDLLARTYDVLRSPIAKLDGALPDRPTPCTEWTLRALVAHTIGGVEMFAAAAERGARAPSATNRAADEVAAATPVERFDAAVARNLAAWRSLTDPAATLTLPFGEFPAEVVAGINQLDSFIHGWDIGVSIGLQVTLPDELSEAAMRMARVRVPNGRGRVFGAEITTAGTSPGERLLAFSGRDPAAWPNDQRRSA